MIRLIIFSLIIAGLTACNTATNDQYQNSHLKYIESNYPADIFPATIQSLEEAHLITQVHDGLIRLNPKSNKLEGRLAKRWVVNNNHDKIIFHLHDNILFHDDDCFENGENRKLDAHDVKYAFEYTFWYKAKKGKSIGLLGDIKGGDAFFDLADSADFESGKLEGIVVRDSLTIVFYLNKSNPGFVYSLVNPDMVILPPEGIKKYGNDCMVGCGAFEMEHFNPKTDSVVMIKNEDYYQKDKNGLQLPYLDRVTAIFEATPAKSLRLIRDEKADFLMTMNQKQVTKFVEENINLFENEDPELVLEQPRGMENTKIFMVRRSKIKNLEYGSMNFLYLDQVKLTEGKN